MKNILVCIAKKMLLKVNSISKINFFTFNFKINFFTSNQCKILMKMITIDSIDQCIAINGGPHGYRAFMDCSLFIPIRKGWGKMGVIISYNVHLVL
jgi:hypothetical protein